ncbi:hypothetical protein A2U01_0093895, partial [Trifolium medium]|nr:hypothetical protein [Trifolium medium]
MKVQTENAIPTQQNHNHQHSERTDNVAEDAIMKDIQYQKG